MTPPWPNKSFNFEHSVDRVAFSPSGSQLAFYMENNVVAVWDRWGKKTLLDGHTEWSLCCLEHSLDGEHLALGSSDGSIRIWRAVSFHAASSQTHRARSTRTPKQADIILVGSCNSSIVASIIALSFSRTDSNSLASGGFNGQIKLWNIKEQACIHSFNPRRAPVFSLVFTGGADTACIALTGAMVIRLWKPKGSSDLASETVGEAHLGGLSLPGAALSPSGSFVATRAPNGTVLALYEIESMTKTQSVVMPGFIVTCVAVSPDSKQLVYGSAKGRIQLLQTNDLSIQRDLDTIADAKAVCSVAFDPTCQFLAIGYRDGILELRSL
jgi:WD40 repeat protein